MQIRLRSGMLGVIVSLALAQSLFSQRLFEGRLDYPTLPFPSALAVADFDKDGLPDVAVVSSQRASVQFFRNVGEAVLVPVDTLALSGRSQGVVAEDFDGDTLPDLLVAETEKHRLRLWRSLGAFQFQAADSFLCGNWPAAMLIADLDGNGTRDVTAANSLSDQVSVFWKRPSGVFSAMDAFITGFKPAALTTLFWPGRPRPDLVVANEGQNNLAHLAAVGKNRFGPAVVYSVGKNPVDVVAGQTDADSLPEVVVACFGSDEVVVLEGQTDNTLAVVQRLPVPKPVRVALEDLNGDGYPELLALSATGEMLQVFAGEAGTFTEPAENYETGGSPRDLVLADMNADGLRDAVILRTQDACLSILLQTTPGRFMRPQILASGEEPTRAVAVDIQPDGLPDLAVIDRKNGRVVIHENRGTEGFAPGRSYFVGATPRELLSFDFNNDALMDLATISEHDFTIILLENLGQGEFHEVFRGHVGVEPTAMAFVPRAGDAPMLAVTSKADQALYLFAHRGGTQFECRDTLHTGVDPFRLLPLDWNGDGLYEVAVVNRYNRSVSLYERQGDRFVESGGLALTFRPADAAVEDFDADGNQDLLLLEENPGRLLCLRARGDGTFELHLQETVDTAAGAMTVRDFNLDGFPDLLIAGRHGRLRAYWNAAGEKLIHENDYGIGPGAGFVLIDDFDRDGRPDAVVSNTGNGTLTVLKGVLTPVWALESRTPLPDRPVAAVQLDEATAAIGYENRPALAMLRTGPDGNSSLQEFALPSAVSDLGVASHADGVVVWAVTKLFADTLWFRISEDGDLVAMPAPEQAAPERQDPHRPMDAQFVQPLQGPVFTGPQTAGMTVPYLLADCVTGELRLLPARHAAIPLQRLFVPGPLAGLLKFGKSQKKEQFAVVSYDKSCIFWYGRRFLSSQPRSGNRISE